MVIIVVINQCGGKKMEYFIYVQNKLAVKQNTVYEK